MILWSFKSKPSLRSYYTTWWHLGGKLLHAPKVGRVLRPLSLMLCISWYTRLYQSRKIQFAQYLKYTIILIE